MDRPSPSHPGRSRGTMWGGEGYQLFSIGGETTPAPLSVSVKPIWRERSFPFIIPWKECRLTLKVDRGVLQCVLSLVGRSKVLWSTCFDR